MTDYQTIYNEVVKTDQRYQLAENSPGLRNVIQATERLVAIAGRSLDVGCGVGFVVQHLSQRPFFVQPHGVDTSDLAVEKTIQRIKPLANSVDGRVLRADSMSLPFDDDYFKRSRESFAAGAFSLGRFRAGFRGPLIFTATTCIAPSVRRIGGLKTPSPIARCTMVIESN